MLEKDSDLRKKFYHPPVSKLIGFRLVQMGKGKAVCEMAVKKQHENFVGTVHGGIICDIADATMGFAFASLLRTDQRGVTVEFKVNFLRPVYAGNFLRAHAKTIFHGKSLYYLECEVKDLSRKLIAKASSTCKVISGLNPA